MSDKQKTISKEITLTGVGLFTGNKVTVVLKSAKVNSGIRFVRTDLPGSPVINAVFENVLVGERLPRCTSVGIADAAIHTVEHLMSVLCGLEIDNLIIEINGNEIPALGGSGIEYLKAIKKAGIVEQDEQRQYFNIKEPIWVESEDSSICIIPAPDYKISYTLDYNHSALRSQFFSVDVTPDIFENEVAGCRTFCLEEESKELQKIDLGKGATYENTLVIGSNGIINNTAHFDNEFARHKVMDFIGDLYLLGVPIRGHVIAIKSGHTLNIELLKKINEQKKKYSQGPAVTDMRESFDGATTLTIEDIMKILPHRYPFLLVDRVTELEQGKRVVAIKNVTANESFFQGHFPTRPIMPGVLIVEAMAQVGGLAVLTSERNKGKIALFLGADKVKFRKVVSPGDQLVFVAEVLRNKTRSAQMRGKVTVNGAVVAEAELLFSYADADYLK